MVEKVVGGRRDFVEGWLNFLWGCQLRACERIFSRSIAETLTESAPSLATEMLPVSSLTMMQTASVTCDMPSAARWRRPRLLGMFMSWLTGRMQPAAVILRWPIIIAPS